MKNRERKSETRGFEASGFRRNNSSPGSNSLQGYSMILRSTGLLVVLVAGLVLGATLPAPAAAQANAVQRLVVPLTDPSQPVRLEVGLMMGSIRVEAYEGTEVIVTATMEEVEEEIEQVDGMFRIPNSGIGLEIEERNNRVEISTGLMNREMELSIQVPRQTSIEASTVNGGVIVVEGVSGELELNNVNGPITALDITGSVVANTTNGRIEVTFAEITPDKPMSFTTWNGDVQVTFPPSFAGELKMSAGQGEILSDFEVELVPQTAKVEREEGRGYRVSIEQEVHGRVGSGGAEFRFKTFNGDILLKRRGS